MTGIPEILQSAPQISQKAQEIGSLGNMVHLALETRKALADPNLFSFLKDSGHPYGLLLLNQAGSAPIGWSIVLSSSYAMSQTWPGLMDERSGKASSVASEIAIPNPTIRGAVSLFLSSSVIAWSSLDGTNSGRESNSEDSSEMSSSSSHPLEFSDGLSGAVKGETKIGKRGISLGAVGINLTKFSGQEPYGIKNSQGEQLAEIKPQDSLAFIHVNRESKELSKMSPLERVQKIKQDLIGLFGLMDNEELFNGLKPEQQAVLTAAQSAVIVGISHLVPMFRRKTGLPFWKLDVLPQAVQQFHCLDSQMVSDKFGGSRKVKPEDVEMMVLTPEMRRKLVAARGQI
ncbi:MAG: hypothetical protein NTZ93_04155 [Candidatus Beckwithbacteria bacterium]|nr:hypothetical protein [Candidatus Beckwithbacteria bacterium]